MTDAILDALRAAASGIGDPMPGPATVPDAIRPARDTDLVAGVPARFVATPCSTTQASAVLRVAAEHDLTIVFRGGGTKLDWANPPRRVDLIVDTGRLTGVVEHAAGDLIAVVRAGTGLDELARTLATAGQQLALDRPLPGATVGGTVATNTSGPRRLLYGAVRDLLIGVTMVRADGVVAHAGGKVVKNVAGYDLGKLVTGGYGTLGLVTECAFRLHPLPAASGYVLRRLADTAELARVLATLRGAQLVPSAVEVTAPPDGPVEVAVLLEGTPVGVAARAEAARRLLGDGASTSTDPPPGWGTYPWRTGDVGLKVASALSGVPDLVAATRAAADRHRLPVLLRGSAGTGVLYAGLPGSADPGRVAALVDDLRAAAGAAAGHAVVLTAPGPVRERVDLWGPVDGLALMRRVKERFDPQARLAPGRFVGGL